MKNFKILCIFMSMNIGFVTHASNTWERVNIEKIIDNKNYKITDGRIIQPIDIDIPMFLEKRKNYQCMARKTKRILKTLLQKHEVKIKKDKNEKKEEKIQQRHIKIDSIYLSEFLIERGLGSWKKSKTRTQFENRFKKAEEKARKEEIGIWSECNTKNKKNPYQLYNWWGNNFRKKYSQYLAPISVGIVQKVISGNSIKLSNGLKIKLLGINVPSPNEEEKGLKCFGTYSKKYLEHLILYKQIFLEKDISDLNKQKELQRYVYLPHYNKAQTQTFINQKMIEEGFAKSNWPNRDEKFKKQFEKIQKEVYKNPKGAWVYCLSEILNPQNPKIEEKETDNACPIKGNISGSKKTYHTPASGWYKRLQYEQCFQTEDEAKNAGFTKVK